MIKFQLHWDLNNERLPFHFKDSSCLNEKYHIIQINLEAIEIYECIREVSTSNIIAEILILEKQTRRRGDADV